MARSIADDPLSADHDGEARSARFDALPSIASLPPAADPTRDLGGALHEVSNALTVVLGWIERARLVALDGDEGDDDTRSLAARADELTRALDVAASRASQARSIVRRAIGAQEQPEPSARVAEVVAETVTGLDPELRRAQITAEQRLDAVIGGRSVDQATTVLQILTNLLLNAIAMSPAGSTVRVEALPGRAGNVVFVVTDEGPGIPEDRRATLFSAGISSRAGGAGIGLRHAAALARVNGGSLALADARAPRGERFELRWPLRASPTTPLPPAPDSLRPPLEREPASGGFARSGLLRAMPLAGVRILLVEDDDAVVDLLDTALTARGADVVSIRHRADLRAAIATGPFDAALFDISPIQDDVRGAVGFVRDACPGSTPLRVVLISGSAAQMPDMPAEWVSAWVRKPFEVAEILLAITPSR